ncbi:MAG: TrkA family potassium uptake protein [Clostridia bacterium]|nr:TrkA family potassium uptake protein [Clostridia bacterium]MCD8309287.1 TrkA family potassium uptake protein [Clostridia bacterium]
MKKNILIIGMGRFGTRLAEKLQDLGHDIMIVDKNEKAVERLAMRFADAQIGDYTSEDILSQLDIPSFDYVVITIGDNLEDSMITTMMLKRLGARFVFTRARSDTECELLKKIGADDVIYADGDATDKLAVRLGGNNLYDYIQLSYGYAIFEVPILKFWEGKTLIELDIRRKYKINIVAIKNDKMLDPTPSPEYRFRQDDHILVIGNSRDVFKFDSKT